jgi:hypothetical protein
MAYSGSIDLISGIRPKNNGTFPLVNAADVYVEGDDTRLPEVLGRSAPAYGTSAEWRANPTFIPAAGRIVIWSDRGQVTQKRVVDGEEVDVQVNVPGIKVGDGTAYNVDLPFVGDDVTATLMALIATHQMDTAMHVAAEERIRWNRKITTGDSQNNFQEVEGNTLILSRD